MKTVSAIVIATVLAFGLAGAAPVISPALAQSATPPAKADKGMTKKADKTDKAAKDKTAKGDKATPKGMEQGQKKGMDQGQKKGVEKRS